MNKKVLISAIIFIAAFSAVGTAQTQKSVVATHSKSVEVPAQYRDYDQKAFEAAKDQKRILFFSAKWCSSCKQADKDLKMNAKDLSKGVVVFKVDYDKEKALKKKYGIPSQHTFVLVDDKGEALEKWSGGATKEVMMRIKDVKSNMKSEAQYMAYTKEGFDAAKGQKRVLYFSAKWCGKCKKADMDFKSNANKLPEGVIVFRADYDKEKDLKKKYGIPSQHTFVLVDDKGEALEKWSGGATKELIAKVNKGA